ncbi:hypothetical protein NE237_032663 [Protea cynaroides]|uniref:Uncharacterized protein n=1 Tax=Protea cynaroides TaxID=273540 RepID=A0A9Q0JTM4_9MAGN|nr:hypothetical protein NE237_026724 [Protea cynaroides]KAJ4981826.1 hypothetical protein NE237_032663 [Protea cynaroides]
MGPNPEAPYYMNLSGWASHKRQTCMKGGYRGTPVAKSYFEGIKEYIEKTSYAPGDLDVQCTVHNGLTEAIQIATEAELAERNDVYSHGVVLLEPLSGKKALVSANDGETSLVTDWAWSLVIKGRALDVIDDDMPHWVTKTIFAVSNSSFHDPISEFISELVVPAEI